MAAETRVVLFDVAGMELGLSMLSESDNQAKVERDRHNAEVEAIAKAQKEARDAILSATPEDAKLEAFEVGEDIYKRGAELRAALKALDEEKAQRLAVITAAYAPAEATPEQGRNIFRALDAVSKVAAKALRDATRKTRTA
jgi:hypothetical protein